MWWLNPGKQTSFPTRGDVEEEKDQEKEQEADESEQFK